MLVGDIINSCSNARVAGAALASIGGEFAARVRRAAAAADMEAGAFVAQEVVSFADDADSEDWAALDKVMNGADHPILVGLRHILMAALSTGDKTVSSAPVVAPRRLRAGSAPRKVAEGCCMHS
ncbi:MAG: hypothetical protein KGQ37_01335 [Hyphomicrobiales bacterium]|nr:hypothetical protein [Hyphomicrobiales bacterium]